MDDLVQVQPVDLRDLVEETPLLPLRFPANAIKNRAAMTSLISDNSERLTEEYQVMVDEASRGEDTTRSLIMKKAIDAEKPKDMGAIINILGDQSVSMQQKQLAIAAINSSFSKDSSVIAFTKAASMPSKGENVEQESVRMTGAEQFAPILQYQRDHQALRNKHEIESKQSSMATVADFVTMLAPFATNAYGGTTLKQISDELNLNISQGKAATLPGSAMMAIKEALSRIPSQERLAVTEKIINIVESNSNLYLNKDNNFVELMQLKQILDGDYSTADKWMDNITGVLDTLGLGSTIAGVSKGVRKLFGASKGVTQEKAAIRGVADTTSPIAPITLATHANPEKARNMYTMIVDAKTDEVAQALAGTNKTDAVASVHNPQPAKADGSVEAKLVDPDREIKAITPDARVMEAVENTGGIHLGASEKKRAATNIYNDVTNIDGLVVHDNMATVGVVGNKKTIDAVFGSTEGGFLKAEDAIAQAKFGLREYGVRDQELSILKKVEGEYVPVELKDVKDVDGDYIVRAQFDRGLNPIDVVDLDALDVKRNWFDRIPSLRSAKSGTVANHLLDAASMLHPRITGAATVAADRAVLVDKKLLELHDSFATKFKGFKSDRQDKVYDYIKEANNLGLENTDNQLIAKGFNQIEIEALKDWRNAWDTHYYLENADLARTLNIQGYKMFDSQGSKFFAKPVQKNNKNSRVYDPATDTVRTLQDSELDQLYEAGGTVAAFRRPTTIGEATVEHMIVRNTPTEYLRGINTTDQVLNYRKGYYQVQYKAPKFITQIVRDAKGAEVYRKAVAMAGSTEEAEHYRTRLARTSGSSLDDYVIREDLKELRVDTDAYWDIQNASGRVGQRHRGKLLEDSSASVTAFDGKYILDPIESSIRAARSLSGRVAAREFLETSKARAMNQYKEFFPSDGMGGVKWVENSNSLVPTTSKTSSGIADARTTVEYLNYLQSGYTNTFDEGFKGAMNAFANMAVKAGANKAEKAFLHMGQSTPTQFLKSGVFTAYLATNPLRQLIVQGHQAVRMTGLAPTYVLSGNMALDGTKYLSSKINKEMTLSKADKEMISFIDESGMLDAVDRHNLIRGSLSDMAEASSPVSRTIGKAVSVPRRAGFDLGEQTNLLAHLLVTRKKAIDAGKDLSDKAVRDEVYSTARAISYDMNFAGDMPYNQNAMGLFLQFFQVPHKAMTSATTNRRIDGATKLRLAATDTILWGVPGATILSNMIGEDMLPESPEGREAVLFGLESLGLNFVLSELAGTDSNIDFSGLSPYNAEGFAHLAHAITSGGLNEFIANSPAFTLYLKDGSRMREAIGRMARYPGFIDTQEGHEPESMISVLSGVAEMSSGWSNALKAKVIYETGRLQDKQGKLLREDASWVEAAAKLFGFNSQEEYLKYAVSDTLFKNKKQQQDTYNSWYKDYIRVLARDQKLNNNDPEWVSKVLGAAKLAFKDDYKAMEFINAQLSKDMLSQDNRIMRSMLEDANLINAADPATLGNLKILNDEEMNKAMRLREDMINAYKQMRE